jgi:hypothetical protein
MFAVQIKQQGRVVALQISPTNIETSRRCFREDGRAVGGGV